MAKRVLVLGFAHLGYEDDVFTQGSTLGRLLGEAWDPGCSVERRGRRWHISEAREVDDDLLAGEFGFVSPDSPTVSWDPVAHRFRRGSAPSGSISPFVVDLRSGEICFQVRPGLIRTTSFTSAMQQMLNARTVFRFTVLPVVDRRQYHHWRADVRRLTRWVFTLSRTAPDPVGVHPVDIVRDLRAGMVRLEADATSEEGLHDDAPLFRHAMEHVQRSQGSGRLTGEDHAGAHTEWHSSGEGGASPVLQKVPARGTVEVPLSVLTEAALRRRAAS